MPYSLALSLMAEDYLFATILVVWAALNIILQAVAGFRVKVTKTKRLDPQDYPLIDRASMIAFSVWLISFVVLFVYDFPLAIISALFGALLFPSTIQRLVFDAIKRYQDNQIDEDEAKELLEKAQAQMDTLHIGKKRIQEAKDGKLGAGFVETYTQHCLHIQPQISNNALHGFGAYADDPFILQVLDREKLLQLHLIFAAFNLVCLERAMRREELVHDKVWEIMWPKMNERVKEFWSNELNGYVEEEHIAGEHSFEKILPELRESLHLVELDFDKNPSYAKPSQFIADYLVGEDNMSKRLASKIEGDIRLIDIANIGILYKLVGSDPLNDSK